MRDVAKRFNLRTIGAGLIAGSMVLALSAGAQARDENWDHDRRDERRDERRFDRHHDRFVDHRHHHYVAERPVYVRERPVIVERPMMYAPPVYQAPYQQQGPSGLNLNFNIPLN